MDYFLNSLALSIGILQFGTVVFLSMGQVALLGSKRRDRQLLAVSAGFGLVATGVAISFGCRRLIHSRGHAMEAANLVFVLAHLAGAAMLCWAFRPARPERMESLGVSNGLLIP